WGMGHCEVCNWPSEPATGERPQAASRAVHRMLYRFHELGVLSDAAYQASLAAMKETLLTKSGAEARPQVDAPAEDEVVLEPISATTMEGLEQPSDAPQELALDADHTAAPDLVGADFVAAEF